MKHREPARDSQGILDEVLLLTPRSPRRALALARHALRRLDGAGTEEQSRLQRALGHALRAVGRHREARVAYRRARRGFAANGNRHEEAICALGLIDACMHLGRTKEALAAAAGARREFTRRRDRARQARLETNVGNLHHRVDALEPALRHYDRAAALMARSGTPAELARLDYNRANVLASLGRIEEAERLYTNALEVLAGSGEAVLAAQVRYGIACLRFLSGHYAAAMSELESVRHELDRLGARGLLALADLDLAEVLAALRLDPEALSLARSAARWFHARSLPAEAARAHLAQALALARMGFHAKALHAVGRAERRFRRERHRGGLASIALVRARILLARGRPRAAAVRAEAAREAFGRAGFATRAMLAGTLGAEALAEAQDDGMARLRARRLLASPRAPGDGFARARLLRLIGRSEAMAGRPREALRHYRAALEETRRSQEVLFVDEWRIEFQADEPRLLDESLDLLLHRRPRPRCEEIWRWIAQAGTPAVRGPRDRPQSLSVRSLQGRLRAELEACYRRLWPEAAGTSRRMSGQDLGRFERRALWLEGRLRRLAACGADSGGERSARRSMAGLRPGSRGPSPLGHDLGPAEARVVYFFAGDRVHALVATARDSVLVPDLGMRAELERSVQLLHYQMDLGTGGPSRLGEHASLIARRAGGHLEDLGAWLAAPIRETLQRSRAVRFVALGTLSRIPFAALSLGGRHLVEWCEVCVEPWPALPHQRSPRAGGASVLGFGSASAPWIENEARLVARRLGGDGARVRLGVGPGARREFLAAGLSSDSVIHLAGHAFYRSEHPEFSALRLADGWLTAADFARWPVDGACVVLSACETGPRGAAGDEMLGLARGLMRSGASAVVASLWRVDDRATREFMDRLYSAWRSRDHLGAALRDVQLQFLRAGTEAHAWAPFILLGRPGIPWPRTGRVHPARPGATIGVETLVPGAQVVRATDPLHPRVPR